MTTANFSLQVVSEPRRFDPLLGREVAELRARAEWSDGRVLIFRYERRYDKRTPDEVIDQGALKRLGEFVADIAARDLSGMLTQEGSTP